jgi:MoxR-like ATPase
MATQNPIEQEGTYPLPEAQLDRFMFKISVPFVNRDELNEIVNRTILKQQTDIMKVLNAAKIMALREILDKVVVADPIRDYAVRIVLSTHPETEFASESVKQFVRWGASPRAAQALIRASRVRALTQGRAHIAYEDIRHFAEDVLRHRVLLNYDGQAEGKDIDALIRESLEAMAE